MKALYEVAAETCDVSRHDLVILGQLSNTTCPAHALQLCVRRHFFTPPKHWKTYQDMVLPYVTAEGQVTGAQSAVGVKGVASCTRGLCPFLRALTLKRA